MVLVGLYKIACLIKIAARRTLRNLNAKSIHHSFILNKTIYRKGE